MRPVRGVHALVPAGIDDPALPSGGNTYDRRVLDGLRALGWALTEHRRAGRGRGRARGRSRPRLRSSPPSPGRVLLVDGLIACASDGVLMPGADRPASVVLVHMPLGLTEPAAGGRGRVLLRGRPSSRRARGPATCSSPCMTCVRRVVHVASPGSRSRTARGAGHSRRRGAAVRLWAWPHTRARSTSSPRWNSSPTCHGHAVLVGALALEPALRRRAASSGSPQPGSVSGCSSRARSAAPGLLSGVCRRRPARAAVPRRDLRHGRDGVARSGHPVHRHLGWAACPRPSATRPLAPPGLLVSTGEPGRAGRRAPSLADRRRPSHTPARTGRRAARAP